MHHTDFGWLWNLYMLSYPKKIRSDKEKVEGFYSFYSNLGSLGFIVL